MMSSPCAMLMTFICPNVSERPSAMRSSTAPMLMPVKSWLTMTIDTHLHVGRGAGREEPRTATVASGQAGGPVVALEVRVGLDRLAGVPDLGDQPVGAHLADPGGLVDVLRRAVDGHLALGRVERDAVGGGLDL